MNIEILFNGGLLYVISKSQINGTILPSLLCIIISPSLLDLFHQQTNNAREVFSHIKKNLVPSSRSSYCPMSLFPFAADLLEIRSCLCCLNSISGTPATPPKLLWLMNPMLPSQMVNSQSSYLTWQQHLILFLV